SLANLPATPDSTAVRLYAEQSASIRTAIAVANTSSVAAQVTFEVSNCDGSTTGLIGTLSLVPNSQTAVFLNQIPGLTALPAAFQGLLRLTSSSPISVVALRVLYKVTGEFTMTAEPPVQEAVPVSGPHFVAHVVDSGAYTTQFVVFNP